MLANLDGMEMFLEQNPAFFNSRRLPDYWKGITRERLADAARLQEIDGAIGGWVIFQKTFSESKGENALLWLRRCWLRPAYAMEQSRQMYFGHEWDAYTPEVKRLRAEGGPLIDAAELGFYAFHLRPSGAAQMPGSDELRRDLVAAQSEPSGVVVGAMWDADKAGPPFDLARKMEKMFWQRPGDDLPYDQVFTDYIRAHAYESAKRFFTELGEFIDDTVTFSNSTGPRRLTLAMMENDLPGMEEALRGSDSGSYSDMVMNIVSCAAHKDMQGLQNQVNECLERYPPHPQNGRGEEDMMSKLKGFLPLVPALNDPADARHAEALDFFGTYTAWPTLQWVFAKNAKLSADETVRFLGGKFTDDERRMMVAYVLKDKELFNTAYASREESVRRGHAWSTMAFVVIHYLRNELMDVPVPAEQPDLKPAGTLSLTGALLARVRENENKAGAQGVADARTADDLWEQIEKMQNPDPQPNTREAVAALLSAISGAAGEFIKRFPDDPRRWDALLLKTQYEAEAGQISGQPTDPKKMEDALSGIANAPAASAAAREGARYGLLGLHLGDAEGGALSADQDKEITAFVKDFPTSPRNGSLQMMRVESFEKSDPAKAEDLLKELAKSPDETVAMEAGGALRVHQLAKKPFQMKFTAIDGSEVDVSKLRGKVVLSTFGRRGAARACSRCRKSWICTRRCTAKAWRSWASRWIRKKTPC